MKKIRSKGMFVFMLMSVAIMIACGGGEKGTEEASKATAEATQTKTMAEKLDGAELYATKTCVTCHGVDGKTPLLPNYPNIAGQTPAYALQQMQDIKSGARDNAQTPAMKAIMTMVSDEEMKTLADYVATFPRKAGGLSQAADSEGAQLFKAKTCVTCHGVDGKTPLMPNYPKIEGQNAEYALQQMQDIKNGARDNAQTAAMKAIMTMVSDDEMKILANYLATLEN